MGMSYTPTLSSMRRVHQPARHLSLAAEEHEWEGQEGRDWERTLVEKVKASMMIK